MRRPRALRLRAAEVLDAKAGEYVELHGVLRASDPVRDPLGGEPLVGYHALCSEFQDETFGGLTFQKRHDVHRWSEAVLVDDSGEATVELDGSVLKVPVVAEATLTSPDKIAKLLRQIGLTIKDAPEQLQVLLRGVIDGARVQLTGRVAKPPLIESAYRASARPRQQVVGVRGAPLVITPRGG